MRRTILILVGSASPAVPGLTGLQYTTQAHEYRGHEYPHHVTHYKHCDNGDRYHRVCYSHERDEREHDRR